MKKKIANRVERYRGRVHKVSRGFDVRGVAVRSNERHIDARGKQNYERGEKWRDSSARQKTRRLFDGQKDVGVDRRVWKKELRNKKNTLAETKYFTVYTTCEEKKRSWIIGYISMFSRSMKRSSRNSILMN